MVKSSHLAGILAAMSDVENKNLMSHVEQISKLKEAADRFVRPCPFKVGDLVTPLKFSDTKGSGDPHVVIDIITDPEPFWTEPGSNHNGQKLDIRVLCMVNDQVMAFWLESATLEQYIPKQD